MMDWKKEIYDKVVAGDADEVKSLTSQAVQQGAVPGELLNEALIAAMSEVGDRFEKREFFVPEMLVAARAMKAGVAVLKPLLGQGALGSAGTIVMGTVAGDLHDIGKNLVIMMFEGAGFRVVDLGVDVQADRFLQAVREHSPQFLGMSALLTTTMQSMKSTIEAVQKAGLRSKTFIMIGGAPVTQRFADEIGADIYGQDANAAVRKVKEAIASRRV
jgi:corrinoid protein of di/trimethylamine methyltransferase